MAEILEKIPLDAETKAVLMGKASMLRPIYQLMLAHESGEWQAVATLAADLHIEADACAAFYWQAQQWAREVSSGA
jgi:c-di-GMP-related signal transduction protein